MKTLAWIWLFLGAAVSADAAAGSAPSRPLLARETGVAPPTRVPKVPEPDAPQAATAVNVADIPKSVRRAVVADAAKRFKVAESAVVLARAEQVTWGDGSLGCPERGVFYTQNLVPGYVIVAKTTTGERVYHTDSREQVKSCGATPPGAIRPPTDR